MKMKNRRHIKFAALYSKKEYKLGFKFFCQRFFIEKDFFLYIIKISADPDKSYKIFPFDIIR